MSSALPPPVGGLLRTAREARGLTVGEVAERTRINEALVAAIEDEDFSRCGGDFFARGHLRSIAAALGMDGREVVRRFDDAYVEPAPLPAWARGTLPARPPQARPADKPAWSPQRDLPSRAEPAVSVPASLPTEPDHASRPETSRPMPVESHQPPAAGAVPPAWEESSPAERYPSEPADRPAHPRRQDSTDPHSIDELLGSSADSPVADPPGAGPPVARPTGATSMTPMLPTSRPGPSWRLPLIVAIVAMLLGALVFFIATLLAGG